MALTTDVAGGIDNTTNSGNFTLGFNNAAVYYNGFIDDARIYNRVLTAQEVHDLYIPGAVLRGAVLNGLKINQ